MSETTYNIQLDERYGHSTLMDLPALIAGCDEKWFNTTLCHVNDAVVRIGIVQGEFHWHHHDDEDELFLVLEGRLLLDIRGDDGEHTVTLEQHQGYTVPAGVVHRTRAPERTVMLMVEKAGVQPTGD